MVPARSVLNWKSATNSYFRSTCSRSQCPSKGYLNHIDVVNKVQPQGGTGASGERRRDFLCPYLPGPLTSSSDHSWNLRTYYPPSQPPTLPLARLSRVLLQDQNHVPFTGWAFYSPVSTPRTGWAVDGWMGCWTGLWCSGNLGDLLLGIVQFPEMLLLVLIMY